MIMIIFVFLVNRILVIRSVIAAYFRCLDGPASPAASFRVVKCSSYVGQKPKIETSNIMREVWN
ncbi:hypothetical protein C8J55DRAFT_152566 [Lentinula edodes]|uniref:Secreted protein n=1 Tax=Lentinula lateritia TaxID=40482 RepID=A0A9W9A0R6_9AGAR|nr:hypothetical protein C8J55DRAFT_152566 [Lentinula edodes]